MNVHEDSLLGKAGVKWVFEDNGHRWSNNNNECGDNFGSFVKGAFAAIEIIHNLNLSSEQLKDYDLIRKKLTEYESR